MPAHLTHVPDRRRGRPRCQRVRHNCRSLARGGTDDAAAVPPAGTAGQLGCDQARHAGREAGGQPLDCAADGGPSRGRRPGRPAGQPCEPPRSALGLTPAGQQIVNEVTAWRRDEIAAIVGRTPCSSAPSWSRRSSRSPMQAARSPPRKGSATCCPSAGSDSPKSPAAGEALRPSGVPGSGLAEEPAGRNPGGGVRRWLGVGR